MSTILVTGAAGFVGLAVARALLARGAAVIGIDNLDSSCDVALKQARLALLKSEQNFTFRRLDVSNRKALFDLACEFPQIDGIIHLAARSDVHQSVTDPYSHVASNVLGQTTVLEFSRKLGKLTHFVYASSCAVYGGNSKLPFAIDDPVDNPLSPYAATKRAAELLAQVYSHLYDIPITGLRFGTVYGPWGRPGSAPFIFTQRILAGEPVCVFNRGEMWRDFIYISDIVDGVLQTLDRPPQSGPTHRLYNLGNDRPERVTSLLTEIERAIGRKARVILEPMRMGDIPMCFTDIEASRRDLDFRPATPLSAGIPKFVEWYKAYYQHV